MAPGRECPRRDFGLCADDSLGERRWSGERSAGDFFCREAAYFAERERDLGLRRQGRVAAGEDQPQSIVLDALVAGYVATAARLGFQRRQDASEMASKRARRRITSIALKRPAETSHARGFAGTPSPATAPAPKQRPREGLFRQVEIAEQPDQRGEDSPRIGAVDGVDGGASVGDGCGSGHRPVVP